MSKTFKRKELALQSGVTQIAIVPFEDGVVEFGTVSSATQWTDVPKVPSMPKRTLRKAFEDLGALYCLYWGLDGTDFHVKAAYENPRDAMRRKQLRGDGESFVKISRDVPPRPQPRSLLAHRARRARRAHNSSPLAFTLSHPGCSLSLADDAQLGGHYPSGDGTEEHG